MLTATLIFAGSIMVSCEGVTKQIETSSEKGKEYTSSYICPMHCEGSGSETTGTCSVCGMDYEKNEKHNSNKHNH